MPAIFAAAFAGGVTIWVSHDIKRYRFLSLDAFFAVPFLVTAVLLPTVCLIIYATKRKRGKKLEKDV